MMMVFTPDAASGAVLGAGLPNGWVSPEGTYGGSTPVRFLDASQGRERRKEDRFFLPRSHKRLLGLFQLRASKETSRASQRRYPANGTHRENIVFDGSTNPTSVFRKPRWDIWAVFITEGKNARAAPLAASQDRCVNRDHNKPGPPISIWPSCATPPDDGQSIQMSQGRRGAML